MENICNYIDMSGHQRDFALASLKSIGFFPAYGNEKTMKRVMDKSVERKLPQFYFVFRDSALIGYMFLIGDEKRFRAFPWFAVDNMDELQLRLAEPLTEIAVQAWNDAGKILIAENFKLRLKDYKKGIGRRSEEESR